MRRCLIVANETLTSGPLLAAVLARHSGEEHEFHVLVPASRRRGSLVWTEGQAVAHARSELEHAVSHFRAEGVDVRGEVGDENPVIAVADVLNRDRFDEIIVSTLPLGASRWLKRDVPHRIAARCRVPVTHVAAELAQVN